MASGAEPIIREATAADLERIHAMQVALAEAEHPHDSNIDMAGIPTAEKWGHVGYVDMAAKLASEDAVVVVAEVGGRAIGVCYAEITADKAWSLVDNYGYVGCVFVESSHRGGGPQGPWPRMLAFLEAWVVSKGVSQLRLEVYSSNAAAVRAYEKAAFKPSIITMHKNLL